MTYEGRTSQEMEEEHGNFRKTQTLFGWSLSILQIACMAGHAEKTELCYLLLLAELLEYRSYHVILMKLVSIQIPFQMS